MFTIFQRATFGEHLHVLSQFMMANGALVRVLIHTDVTKYLLFKAVDGSYVYKQGKVCIRNFYGSKCSLKFSCR